MIRTSVFVRELKERLYVCQLEYKAEEEIKNDTEREDTRNKNGMTNVGKLKDKEISNHSIPWSIFVVV